MEIASPSPISVVPDRSKSLPGKILKSLHLWEFAFQVRLFFLQLLRVDRIRLWVARIRFFFLATLLRRFRTIEPETGDIGVNTVYHNRLQMKKWLGVNRSSFLISPLSALRLSRSTPVLCIGPRSEGELLNLMGQGFQNVRGLDLMTYSPWIDLGDMHQMPYADNAYGVVMMGWVLAYSENRTKAAKEAVRVVKNGGIIAVGVQFIAETSEAFSKKMGYQICDEERIENVAGILTLFGDHVDRIYFTNDRPSEDCKKCELLVIFSVKK